MEAMAVHVLLRQEGEHHTAHCLEFDLVAQGASTDEAVRNLLDAVDLQASYAEETGDMGALIQPAPAEYWRELADARPCPWSPNGRVLPAVVSHLDCSRSPR